MASGWEKAALRPTAGAALEKKPADFAAFLRLMEESGFAVKRGRGGVVSFLAPGQNKYTRLRASTLGAGFDPENIRAVIAGEQPLPELPKDAPPPPRQVGLIIDIQQRMAEGKGPAYERWANTAVFYSEMITNINSAPLKKSQSHRLNDQIAAKEKELTRITRYKQSLYQDWKDGEITQQEYRDMKSDYERQAAELADVLARLNAERAELAKDAYIHRQAVTQNRQHRGTAPQAKEHIRVSQSTPGRPTIRTKGNDVRQYGSSSEKVDRRVIPGQISEDSPTHPPQALERGRQKFVQERAHQMAAQRTESQGIQHKAGGTKIRGRL